MTRDRGVSNGVVKLRIVNGSQSTYRTLGLSIPSSLTPSLESMLGQHFTCELTDEGILFRPMDPIEPVEVPEWVRS